MKDNIHNYERKLERSLERIKNSEIMIKENKEFVNKFLAQLKLDLYYLFLLSTKPLGPLLYIYSYKHLYQEL